MCGYLPAKKYGGTVTCIANIVENMGEKYNIYIIASNHDLGETKPLEGIHSGWNRKGKAKVLYLKDSQYTVKNFVELLKAHKADCVYLSGIFSYQVSFPAIRAAKLLNIPIVLAPRGELCKNALNIHRLKKELFIRFIKIIGIYRGISYQATSQEEYNAIKKIWRCCDKKIYMLPDISCSTLQKEFTKKQAGKGRFVFLSRIHEKKNLLYAIERLQSVKEEVIFDIYGPIEQKEYWERCCKELEHLPSNVIASYQGIIEPMKSQEVFKNYDCLIFPTLSENYGHVVPEAITAGCHVIISKGTTPWDDMQNQGGFVVPLERPEEWVQCIEEVAKMTQSQKAEWDRLLFLYADKKLDISKLIEEYSKMFEAS